MRLCKRSINVTPRGLFGILPQSGLQSAPNLVKIGKLNMTSWIINLTSLSKIIDIIHANIIFVSEVIILQAHHVYSMLKLRGNDRFRIPC